MFNTLQNPVWLAVGGLTALAAALGVGRFVYTPILPLMIDDLGMTATIAGALASANFAGYLAGALVAASSILPGSRRRWLLVSLSVSAITTGAMGLVGTTTAFFVLRFVGGCASAFVLVFSSAIVLDQLNEIGRSKLAIIHFGGVGTGITVSAVLVSLLVTAGGKWDSLWLGSGIISIICLLLVFVLIPDRAEPQVISTSGAAAYGSGLRNLVFAYGLFGFGYVITATFLVTIVRSSDALRSSEPVVWVLVGLAAAPSVALWAFVANRLGNRKAFALACVVEAVGVIASVVWLSLAGIVVSALFLGGTFMGITALGLVEARRLSFGEPRRTLAIMTASFGLGQILGPTLAGFGRDLTGSFLAPSIGAASALIIAAMLVIVRRD